MQLLYIWYKDQRKPVIEHKVGRKYIHYLIIKETGVTTVKIAKTINIKSEAIEQDLKKAATTMLGAGQSLGITKTATRILEGIINND